MKNLKNKISLFVLSLVVVMTSCSDSKNEPDPSPPTSGGAYFSLSKTEFKDIPRIGTSFTIDIDTNVDDIELQSTEEWCEAKYKDGKIEVIVKTNSNFPERNTRVKVESKSVSSPKFFSVYQKGVCNDLNDVKEGIKQKVSSGKDSSHQGSSSIEKTFDGIYGDPIYHSNWSNTGPNYWPITLQYFFEDVEAIDYLVYYPRTSGSNGHFKEVEIWARTKSEPLFRMLKSTNMENEKLLYDEDFGGTSTPKRVDLAERLVEPIEIKFVVKSGVGPDQGFASCAQMDFLMHNPEAFDYNDLFTDETCSALKTGITKAQIEEVKDDLYRNLALDIFNGNYDKEFRVQSYDSYEHPDKQASINKTSPYGLRDNPTGIYATKGEDLIVFCEDPKNASVGLFIQDTESKNTNGGSSFPLAKGFNRISATQNGGLIYILYYTPTGTEKPLKINIMTGDINGYFDLDKHDRSEWTTRLNKAKAKHFDLKGKKSVLTFETEKLKLYTKNGADLLNLYDQLVDIEQEFMGLKKYKDKSYKNRMYFVVSYKEAYMYATSYHTGYSKDTQSFLLDEEKFVNQIWGPAHEVGHMHQTRPGFKWIGMTEVTNNVHSMIVQTTMSGKSRLMQDDKYGEALRTIVDRKLAHNTPEVDVFLKTVPFWQLKLYLHDVLGKTDFYPDLYEKFRTTPNAETEGKNQIEFVRKVCDVAQLNLLDFFEAWGFLKACDFEINDYVKAQFTVTQEDIDEVKQYVKNKGYAKPKHDNIYTITDENWKTFR